MTIGSKIKTLREDKKLTQDQLAKMLGVTNRSVAYYESDQRQPKKASIIKLCEIFNVSTDYLLTEEEQFLMEAEDAHGYRGKKKARELINETSALFAGGELSDEDKDKFFKVMTEIYWDSKEKNKKYTPKKYID